MLRPGHSFYPLALLLLTATPNSQADNTPSPQGITTQDIHTLAHDIRHERQEAPRSLTRRHTNVTPNDLKPRYTIPINSETSETSVVINGLNDFHIPWHTLDGGGGMQATVGDFMLSGTMGQPDAGIADSGDLTLVGGFWALHHFGAPNVLVPSEIPATFGDLVEVPILFNSNGLDIAAAIFSFDYDESCLGFNPTDADFDQIPDNVSFSLPEIFSVDVDFDQGDADGELDFVIFDAISPLDSLPDGPIATITLNALCDPIDTTIIAATGFSEAPPPTFGDTEGRDVQGSGVDGSVAIYPGTRGDCNDDGLLGAGDLSACVLEVFDGDGDFWLNVAGGSFTGLPVGCDANADTVVNAGDLSCKILLIFEGPGACTAARRLPAGWGQPLLAIDQALGTQDGGVSVPITFESQGWQINSVAFSLDYDARLFAFDPSDKDGDGIPESIQLDLSASAQATVSFDPTDTAGEIDISIFDPYQVLDRGSGEALFSLTLRPLAFTDSAKGGIRFSSSPAPSFGDLSGQSVEGSADNNANE